MVDSAINEYMIALSYDSEDYSTHSNLAVAYKEKKMYNLAFHHYGKAIDIAPNEPGLYFNLGLLHRKLNEFKAAESCFSKAVALDSTNFKYFLFLGGSLALNTKYEESFDACLKAIELNPNFGLSHLCLGTAAISLGDSARAYREFIAAMELEPKIKGMIERWENSPISSFLRTYDSINEL
jgi:tetratricopeptide (TPR) repeat protein